MELKELQESKKEDVPAKERGCKEHVTYKLYGRGLNLNMSIVYYIVVVFCFIQL